MLTAQNFKKKKKDIRKTMRSSISLHKARQIKWQHTLLMEKQIDMIAQFYRKIYARCL